jgi:hypothetical protein
MLTNRRHLMGALAASGATFASAVAATSKAVELDLSAVKKETDLACLYHASGLSATPRWRAKRALSAARL